MDFIKKTMSLFLTASLFFVACESSAENKKKIDSTLITGSVLLKRRSQLASALFFFKNRIKHDSFLPAPLSPLPIALPPNQLSQTEAYMHRFKKELYAHWMWSKQLKDNDALIKKILVREQEYVGTHYVFYHAHQSEARLIHDVLKELYQFFFQQKLSHFTLLRFWKDTSNCKNPREFLSKHSTYYKGFENFDHQIDIRQQLLAVNLSLFGNRTNSGECTFYYFLYNWSVSTKWSKSYLNDLFTRLDINTNYIAQLTELLPTLQESKNGQLLQIFIPKSTVDTYVYPSHAFGIPHGPIAAAPANIAFDASLNRHNSIVPILESYQKKPFEMDSSTYDEIQARIVLNNALFDHQASNVKIYRYSTISKEKTTAYKQRLHEIIASALDEWCSVYAKTKTLPIDLKGTRIDTLLKTIT